MVMAVEPAVTVPFVAFISLTGGVTNFTVPLTEAVVFWDNVTVQLELHVPLMDSTVVR